MGYFRTLHYLIFLIGLCSIHFSTLLAASRPHEELMVVQTVSTDRRSFVVAKGVKDGIATGQEVIFANENVSILCRAYEVNRNYSLWRPIDKNINIPFNKEDFISYNSHAYGNVALEIVGDINNLTPEVNYDIEFRKFRSSNNFSLKASFDQGFSQSSSDVSADNNSKRSGFSYALEYNFRFLPEFEMSFGGRIDNEVYRLTDPQLDIPTTRVMGTIAATYHLMAFSKNKNNFYLTLAAGIGKSTTTVNEETSSGIVTLLPEVRLGHIMPYSKSVAMIFEASIESLSAHEKFSDNTEQVTNILSAKLTLGLRF
ncbi:MAG: hypothetical protein Q7U04_02015 [Bacteriovorax sp.]|nr:hypothetical protein [Bacteriovorax sp.]